jgi:hypothetical protein
VMPGGCPGDAREMPREMPGGDPGDLKNPLKKSCSRFFFSWDVFFS